MSGKMPLHEPMQRSKSTHKELAEEIGYQESFFKLWDYLQDNAGATQTEILKDDDHRVAEMRSRPVLSDQLNSLLDEGVVRYESSPEDNRIKRWFVVEDWEREPLEQPHTSLEDFVAYHWGFVSVILTVGIFGCILGLYELFRFSLGYGPLPELLVVSSGIGLGIVLGIGAREVYL